MQAEKSKIMLLVLVSLPFLSSGTAYSTNCMRNCLPTKMKTICTASSMKQPPGAHSSW